MKILVSGGCGYVGSVMIPKLLNDGHTIINIDTRWFGNYLPKHKKLNNIKLNLSDIEKLKLKNIDCCIHLASIANDPMAELDKNFSWETSALNSYKLMEYLKKIKVKRIIYASSGSVYGISKKTKVTEQTPLKPISLYNKVKMVTERLILSYSKNIEVFIIRPATVCGYSPRMRFDLSVNILTHLATRKKEITVFGGKQMRPNLHIKDMCDFYQYLLEADSDLVGGQTFNISEENISIENIASKVKQIFKDSYDQDIKIKKVESEDDKRSYYLNSDKVKNHLKFELKYNVDDAIHEIYSILKKDEFSDSLENDQYYNIRTLKKLNIS